MQLRIKSARTAVAVVTLAAGPFAIASTAQAGIAAPAGSASISVAGTATAQQAAVAPDPVLAPAATAALTQCQSVRRVTVGTAGWSVTAPSVWESTSLSCNLKYGDDPHRGTPFGDPARAIRNLQGQLNYCYASGLTADGVYGAQTRAAIRKVQQRHKLTVDGVYGPATRSAMNWRLYNTSKKVWSTNCYSSL